MSGRASVPGTVRGQHYLADRQLAVELVAEADLQRGDLVVEGGAGSGHLTEEFACRSQRVIAIEADPRAAARLRCASQGRDMVTVVAGDVLQTPLPLRPFRVVANPPFYLTGALLRHLLDDRPPLARADQVLDWRAAIGLCAVSPPSRLPMAWQPWFELLLVRRLAAERFQPEPSIDAAVVSIRRRRHPLLPSSQAAHFRRRLGRRPPGDVWDLAHEFRQRGRRRPESGGQS